MLDKHELAFAMEVLRDKPAGRYMLRELFGDEWQWIRRPRAYGRCFKASVRSGALPGVHWVGKKSNNCLLYEVLPASTTGWSPSRK